MVKHHHHLAKLLKGKIKVYDNIKMHSVNFIVIFFLLKLSRANMQFQSMDFITTSSSIELFWVVHDLLITRPDTTKIPLGIVYKYEHI